MTKLRRLVFFSPMGGTQKTLHDVKTVITLLQDPQILSEVDRVLIFHDESTHKNAKSLAREVSKLASTKPDVQYHALPNMNTLMDDEIVTPLQNDDIILASGSGSHLGLILHNLKTNSQLIGKSLLLVHPRPNGVSLGVYKYHLSFDEITVEKLDLQHPNPVQSLRGVLKESGAEIGEVYPRSDTLSQEYRSMVELESQQSAEDFRELLMSHYQISIERAGEKMEVIAGALLSSMYSHFTEIYGNILFSRGDEPLKFQEEDILAMLTNGDIIWFSSKYSIQSATINHERQRLLAKLPINFPDKRIHRVILTFSGMAERYSQSEGSVLITGLASLHSKLDQFIERR